MSLHIKTTINNESAEFLCGPFETASHALRERLLLTGTKEGCNTGDCGACSIELNGQLVCACLVLAAELDGQNVTTIEGIASGNNLHPVQKKLLEHNAFQCGICIPGIVIAAKALLDTNHEPNEEEVRFWLAGNLCRCTGYDKIVRAILDAAGEMRGVSDAKRS
jgi:carbon-monoxide dehydrogenase small subunit